MFHLKTGISLFGKGRAPYQEFLEAELKNLLSDQKATVIAHSIAGHSVLGIPKDGLSQIKDIITLGSPDPDLLTQIGKESGLQPIHLSRAEDPIPHLSSDVRTMIDTYLENGKGLHDIPAYLELIKAAI
ncbi:MAG: hypothetical protein ACK481_00140 [Candidatus Melainabacteria bacterium]|jgi:hypothetical protein